MTDTPAHHPHKDCHKCQVFFKCEQLPPCAPHTSPPAQHLTYTVGECMEQCQMARKDERERMLPYLEELASPSVSDARKREILQSLRAQQQGGVSE